MIVENGTGLEDSNSYVSVEFADDYFSARGLSEWSLLTQSQKEQALIRATDFIDNIFQWNGKKATKIQALRFPRIDLVDYESNLVIGIPNNLKQAVCDVAIKSTLGTELFKTENENGDVTSERIGDLSFTYSKSKKSNVSDITIYEAVNTKLRGLYKDNSKNTIFVGKVLRV